jgi:hypothetical protein
MNTPEKEYTAFLGHARLAKGRLEGVVGAAKEALDKGETERLAIYRDEDARVLDFDFRGSLEEVLERLGTHPIVGAEVRPPPKRRGPGRPKLGVVSREITLLPRHWEWLAEQRGGASATIRRLVEEARKQAPGGEQDKRIQGAVYSFISDLASDLPGFEEASRALFAAEYGKLEEIVGDWPGDIQAYMKKLRGRKG